MIDLASALVAPLAKLLLKSWLGDTGADMGMNLYGLAIGRLKDKVAARAAVRQANTVANAVVTNFETFLLNERVDEDSIEPAAFELGETISRHVTAEFLISKQLDVAAIQNGLLAARPVDQIYRPIAHRPRQPKGARPHPHTRGGLEPPHRPRQPRVARGYGYIGFEAGVSEA